MKNGKRPTLKQRKVMLKNNIDPSMYLVSKVLPDYLECVPKAVGETKKAFYKVSTI